MKSTTRPALGILLVTMLPIMNLPIFVHAASPGALDQTFGTGGKVVTDVAFNDFASGVAVQVDGKIIVAGRANVGGGGGAGFDLSAVRYNSNGSLDTTFDGDGKVTTDISGRNDLANGVAVQSDGKIVLVGRSQTTGGGPRDIAFVRYNPNGSLDTTFDGDGIALVDAGGTNDEGFRLAIQPDGRIVGAGLSGTDWAIVRVNPNGGVDNTFDGDGVVVTDFGGATDFAFDLRLLPDGRILAAGQGNSDFALARYTFFGVLDTSFDTDGKVTTDFSGALDIIDSLEVQVDGKAVASGRAVDGGDQDSAVARYNTNGSPDNSFDADGKLRFDVSPGLDDLASDLALLPNGKIVTAGSTNASGGGDFYLRQYNGDGSVDSGFGLGGIIRTSFAEPSVLQSSALHGAGLVVAGVTGAVSDIAIARYNLAPTPTQSGDFDGDGFTDSTVFRPSSGTWFTLNSGSNTVSIEQFGLSGDIPVDGDFDGDSRADLCIFRPSNGEWYFKRSSNGTVLGAQFGATGDKPVGGDYDKDGKSDIAIWRPSNGNYFILRSSTNFSTFFAYPFGTNGDIPVQGGAQ